MDIRRIKFLFIKIVILLFGLILGACGINGKITPILKQTSISGSSSEPEIPLGDFSILGIQSPTLDTTDDIYLNSEPQPKVHFDVSSLATSYEMTVYESDGITVRCVTQTTTVTTFTPLSCNLTAGSTYKLRLFALDSSTRKEASNSPYTFIYNRAPVVPTRGTWNVTMNGARTVNAIADDPATGPVDPATDPDGDTMTVIAVSAASNGATSFSGSNVTYTPATDFDGTDSFTFTVSDGHGATTTATINVRAISAYHWMGTTNTAWDTGTNWCGSLNGSYNCSGGGSAPGASDLAIFDDYCATTALPSCDATIAATTTVGGLLTRSGYIGTITQNTGAHFTVGTKNLVLNAGNFLGSTNASTNIAVQGDFKFKVGSTFRASAGTLSLGRSLTATSCTALNYEFLGTFQHNSGIINFISSCNFNIGVFNVANISMTSPVDLNHLTLSMLNENAAYNSSGLLSMANATDRFNVNGNMTITSGTINNGITYLYGNLSASCAAANSCARLSKSKAHKIYFVGSTNSTYTVVNQTYGAPQIGSVIINKNSNTQIVSSSDNRDIRFTSLEIQTGEFVAPSGTLFLGKTWEYPNGSGDGSGIKKSGGIFTHGGGTVRIDPVCQISSGGSSVSNCFGINISSHMTLNHFSLKPTNSNPLEAKSLISVTTSAALTVNGNLTVDHGFIRGGQIYLNGNFVANCADSTYSCAHMPFKYFGDADPTQIIFSGSAAQTYQFAAGARTSGFVIQKTLLADTVSPVGASDLNVSSIEVKQGTLNLSNNTTRIGAYFAASSANGRGLVMMAGAGNGSLVHPSSGTMIFDSTYKGASGYAYVVNEVHLNGRSLGLQNVIIDQQTPSDGGALFLVGHGDDLTINGDFTLESGVLVQYDFVAPTLPSMKIIGNISINCSNSITRCSKDEFNINYGLMAQFSGGAKSITMANGAKYPFRSTQLNLSSNVTNLTLMSSLSNNHAQFGGPWGDLTLSMGRVDLNGNSWTNIKTLNITAGTTCSGVLGYASASGATGSGCGP